VKVGDMVQSRLKDGSLQHGILVEKRPDVRLPVGQGKELWFVLRSDTNKVDMWHPDHIEVISESR
jgi:hypothetical protein